MKIIVGREIRVDLNDPNAHYSRVEEAAARLPVRRGVPTASMDQLKRLGKELISTLGTLPLPAIDPSQSVLDAVDLMRSGKGGCVLACEGRRVVGILTERDVLRRMGTSMPLDVPIAEAMSRQLWPVRPSDPIGKALKIMRDRQCRHLAVVDDAGNAVGVLSIKKLVREIVELFPSTVYNLPPVANQVSKNRDGA